MGVTDHGYYKGSRCLVTGSSWMDWPQKQTRIELNLIFTFSTLRVLILTVYVPYTIPTPASHPLTPFYDVHEVTVILASSPKENLALLPLSPSTQTRRGK